MEILLTVLKGSAVRLGSVYYGFLCLWSLSFYEECLKRILSVSDSFFELVEVLLGKFQEIKIVRMVCRILRNLFLFSQMEEILIKRVKLAEMLKSLSKKNFKDKQISALIAQISSKFEKLKSSKFL